MKETKVVYNANYGFFDLSDKALELYAQKKNIDPDNIFIYAIPRHDPDLVSVVEELGTELASTDFSNLAITKVYSTRYRLDVYDGYESVMTPANYNWIEI